MVEHPIHYVVLHDDDKASFFNHVILVTEESAEVTYVETTFQMQVVMVTKLILFPK